jgi:hypothetical protein
MQLLVMRRAVFVGSVSLRAGDRASMHDAVDRLRGLAPEERKALHETVDEWQELPPGRGRQVA